MFRIPTLTTRFLLRSVLPIAAVFVLMLLVAQWLGRPTPPPAGTPRDYEAIAREGVLRVVTEYDALDFHVAGDTVAGFQYELVQAFARDHGLKAEVSPVMEFNERLEGVAHGRYDLIAIGIPTTSALKDSLLLSRPVLLSRQVLVQRLASDSDSLHIGSPLYLAGKTLHVPKGSPALLRIHNLANEIGDTIYIREVERYGAEQLIYMVAHGDIDYAVCDEHIARAAADSLPVDIKTAIGFTQFCSWGVSKQSPQLLDSLNAWLDRFMKQTEYHRMRSRYAR